MSASEDTNLYERYDEWKGWTEPFAFTHEQADYFAAELGDFAVTGRDVLEIGFGSGGFLGWARAQGARVIGSEVTPAAVSAAKSAGIGLLPSNFERSNTLAGGSLDLVAALDVFEHLTPDAITAKLAAIDGALRPDGRVLLRYPNGQSPFGLGAQHGDATHLTALSRSKIEQYATGTNLVTLRYGGVARPTARDLKTRIARAIRYRLRDSHAAFMRFLYATDTEFEPVVTHILVKRA